MDVVQGRGHDAYTHPGNVYFRKLVEQNFREYSKVPGQQLKHGITMRILEQIKKRGGRFVKPAADVTDDSGRILYVRSTVRAAASKTTKAMRRRLELDKKKKIGDGGGDSSGGGNDDNGDDKVEEEEDALECDTFSVEHVNIKKSSSANGRKRKINSQAWSAHDEDASLGGGGYGDGDDDDEASAEGRDDHGAIQWQPFERQRSYDRIDSDFAWNDNFRRLREFHKAYGHAAVPVSCKASTESSNHSHPVGHRHHTDQRFADWVSMQRQLFREIQSGFRIATPKEEARWQQLRALNFPLDYESWHWRRRFNELREALEGAKYDETIHRRRLSPQLQSWLNQQQKLMSKPDRVMDRERKGKLEQLGVSAGAFARGGPGSNN